MGPAPRSVSTMAGGVHLVIKLGLEDVGWGLMEFMAQTFVMTETRSSAPCDRMRTVMRWTDPRALRGLLMFPSVVVRNSELHKAAASGGRLCACQTLFAKDAGGGGPTCRTLDHPLSLLFSGGHMKMR